MRSKRQKRNKRPQRPKHTKITSVAFLAQVALRSGASSFMSHMTEFDKHRRALAAAMKKDGEYKRMATRVNALNLDGTRLTTSREIKRAEAIAKRQAGQCRPANDNEKKQFEDFRALHEATKALLQKEDAQEREENDEKEEKEEKEKKDDKEQKEILAQILKGQQAQIEILSNINENVQAIAQMISIAVDNDLMAEKRLCESRGER